MVVESAAATADVMGECVFIKLVVAIIIIVVVVVVVYGCSSL